MNCRQSATIVPNKNQFSGSLVGQCLGDALGFVVEGQTSAICKQYIRKVTDEGMMVGNGRYPFQFGQYSDDSQLARELLQSYIECGRFDPSDYAKRIAAIFKENRIVGRGRATEEAAIRLSQGISWQEAGTPPLSAGNGSAMRAGPIGLLFFDDYKLLVRSACDQGRITHKDMRCSAGAVAIAGAVALAIQLKTIDVPRFLDQLSKWTRDIDESVSKVLLELKDWVLLPPEEAVNFISLAGLESDYTDRYDGISPFVVPSVLWGLYSFLRTPDNFLKTICTAIEVGGDVDTTAAMAGAISGGYLGLDSIHFEMARYLNDQGGWGYNELVRLAEKCYGRKMSLFKS